MLGILAALRHGMDCVMCYDVNVLCRVIYFVARLGLLSHGESRI